MITNNEEFGKPYVDAILSGEAKEIKREPVPDAIFEVVRIVYEFPDGAVVERLYQDSPGAEQESADLENRFFLTELPNPNPHGLEIGPLYANELP